MYNFACLDRLLGLGFFVPLLDLITMPFLTTASSFDRTQAIHLGHSRFYSVSMFTRLRGERHVKTMSDNLAEGDLEDSAQKKSVMVEAIARAKEARNEIRVAARITRNFHNGQSGIGKFDLCAQI